jgi:hypothetical protein
MIRLIDDRLHICLEDVAMQHISLDISSCGSYIHFQTPGSGDHINFPFLRRIVIMDTSKIAKQTIEFYKTTFNNTFNVLMMLQEQTQRLLKLQLDQTSGIPEEGKKVIAEWVKNYKKGCEEFKNAVDESFKRVESFFMESGKTEKKP